MPMRRRRSRLRKRTWGALTVACGKSAFQAAAQRINLLGCHFSFLEIVLCGNAKGVCNSIEKCEQSCNVNRFRDLIFFPACLSKLLNVLSGGAISGVSNQFGIIQQGTFRGGEAGLVQLAFESRDYALIGGSLDTQEVSVAVQSIRAAIQVRDVAGDHLFVPASEMPFGEMNGVREIDDLAQEVRTRTEAFDDAGDLYSAGALAPVVVCSKGRACRFGVFRDSDFCGGFWSWRLSFQISGLVVCVIFRRHA